MKVGGKERVQPITVQMPEDTAEHVTIHGCAWKWSDIKPDIDYICEGEGSKDRGWRKQKWARSPAISYKNEVRRYTGQKYDPDRWTLDETGWDHDHCRICWWTLFGTDDPASGEGYTDGHHWWICTECFERFIAHRVNE